MAFKVVFQDSSWAQICPKRFCREYSIRERAEEEVRRVQLWFTVRSLAVPEFTVEETRVPFRTTLSTTLPLDRAELSNEDLEAVRLKIAEGTVLGELEKETPTCVLRLNQVSHRVSGLREVDGGLVVDILVLDTPEGNKLKNLLLAKLPLLAVPRVAKGRNNRFLHCIDISSIQSVAL